MGAAMRACVPPGSEASENLGEFIVVGSPEDIDTPSSVSCSWIVPPGRILANLSVVPSRIKQVPFGETLAGLQEYPWRPRVRSRSSRDASAPYMDVRDRKPAQAVAVA